MNYQRNSCLKLEQDILTANGKQIAIPSNIPMLQVKQFMPKIDWQYNYHSIYVWWMFPSSEKYLMQRHEC